MAICWKLPRILRYRVDVTVGFHTVDMRGDNPTGGDNQQGRPRGSLTPDYVVGFIDGEGCFSISVRPHPSIARPRRWLISPAFQAYQHRDSVDVLHQLSEFFGCGSITSKGPNSKVMTYSVHSKRDLVSVIIPFFEKHRLLVKRDDFAKFSEAVRLMTRKAHRTPDGLQKIIELAFSMNQRGKQRRYRLEEVLSEPSETVRQAPLFAVKIQSEPHGDMRRATEMIAPSANG